MNALKRTHMMAAYNGFTGPQTISHVQSFIPEELFSQLTGRQLGLVLSAVNQAYHAGKTSAGAEMLDSNAVWISGLDRVIEWKEEGAEYEPYEETEIDARGVTCITRGSKKIKAGTLVPRFSDNG